ncbi:hypothetical protein SCHPADRAFT_863750 [Schizopora paradoxa]|uniref:Uncharacterized protein n=1 Tax=Schizopora paradoxa TaxID=27342 RepID=A0A0H2S7U7_9AGAM|nr:hypothetical protein SCHPADRAFT_863750 [Schizopora paradoxa]
MSILRTAAQTSVRSVIAARSIHSSPVACRTVTEAVKETAHKVNIGVGQTLAKGIEKGGKATETVQETVGVKTQEAKQKTNEATATARHKAGQAQQGAKEAKQDIEGNLKK